MSTDIANSRNDLVKYLREELIGPRFGDGEELTDPPNKRYTMGILFPQEVQSSSVLDEEEEDTTGNTGSENEKSQFQDQGDDPVVMANQFLPSSMGISFYLRHHPGLRLEVTTARYLQHKSDVNPDEGKNLRKKRLWKREKLEAGKGETSLLIFPDSGKNHTQKYLFEKSARVYAIWREINGGWLVTVTLINEIQKSGRGVQPDECLYQVNLKCQPTEEGLIPEYPRNQVLSNDEEERILDVLYRKKKTFGVGHGCSVDWEEGPDGSAISVNTELMPSEEVPQINYDFDDEYGKFDQIRSLFTLATGESNRELIIHELDRFVHSYEKWIKDQPNLNLDIPEFMSDVRDRLLGNMENVAERMRGGVRVLENDPNVFRAFCLANRAMLLQYIHSLEKYGGKRKKLGEIQDVSSEIQNYNERAWRPFQLAFQLLTISSVAYPESPDREFVDLIWFPTGGGKTEAYLAVAAFQIFYRRIVHGDRSGGTAIIMRYTLRLLTTQQFQRAATLICACEMIRRELEDDLGDEACSIGLWIGGNPTKSYETAFDHYKNLLIANRPRNPFMLDLCPWCGTEIIPTTKEIDEKYYGIRSSSETFELHCPEESCPFHEILPVRVIDQHLYQEPPTLILATVDKFARITWVGETRAFFGGGNRRPPELIIQDELHLIAGPLGTIVGVYETAIDLLASWEGTPPKILASTATIRRAEDQSIGLYGRQVKLFPPSGLEMGDSYFARYDYDQPGRLYVGVMGQGHTPPTSMIRTSAALLQGPLELNFDSDSLDAYWTLVAYHNSLRELGKSLTFGKDDIPARIKVIASDQDNLRSLNDDNIDELTSNKDASELAGMLERMDTRYHEDNSLSLLVCTNMFSVGVDVQRLGLMQVIGQPKSTSEYIQSTSRVGRGVPGLIVCMLSPTKPRDRSHYERFKSYHSALYRFVEPTSVTPFSPPARDRALHAVLVTLVRHKLGLDSNDSAIKFSSSLEGLDDILRYINDRVMKIDPRETANTIEYVQKLIEEWEHKAQQSTRLEYNANTRAKPTLLVSAGFGRKDGWETMHSMRNVDRSCVIKVVTGKGI